MTMKFIQSRARELRSKTRRKLAGAAAGPLAACFLYAFGIGGFPSLRHVLHPLFAGALAWSVIGIYFLSRGMWSVAMPADSGLITGLEFCLEEMERQRTLLRRVLLWSLAPVLAALSTFVLGLALIATADRGLLPNGIPFLASSAVWVVGYFVMRGRELGQLKREIDELTRLHASNSESPRNPLS